MAPTPSDAPMTTRQRHRHAALALCALIANAACLVTETIEVQEAQPTPANTPPRIHEESASPANGSVIEPTSCALQLSIGVVEEWDASDELTARWFVDDALLASSRLPPQDDPLREGPRYTFEVARHAPGPHAVLVAISDGFADGADLRAAREGKAVVSYEWALDTSAASACVDQPESSDEPTDTP